MSESHIERCQQVLAKEDARSLLEALKDVRPDAVAGRLRDVQFKAVDPSYLASAAATCQMS